MGVVRFASLDLLGSFFNFVSMFPAFLTFEYPLPLNFAFDRKNVLPSLAAYGDRKAPAGETNYRRTIEKTHSLKHRRIPVIRVISSKMETNMYY